MSAAMLAFIVAGVVLAVACALRLWLRHETRVIIAGLRRTIAGLLRRGLLNKAREQVLMDRIADNRPDAAINGLVRAVNRYKKPPENAP